MAARAHALGVELEFSAPIDAELAESLQSYEVRRWNYQWTHDYGSAHYSLEHPGREGEDVVTVLSAHADPTAHKVLVELERMRPCDQLLLRFELRGVDREPVAQEVYLTVQEVPK